MELMWGFTTLLIAFGAGLVFGRNRPVALTAAVFVAVGVMTAGSDFGEFVGTILSEAQRLIT